MRRPSTCVVPAGRSGVRIPLEAKFLFQNAQTFLGPSQPPVKWVPGFILEGKAAGTSR